MHGRYFPFLRRETAFENRDIENPLINLENKPTGGFLSFLEYQQIPSRVTKIPYFEVEILKKNAKNFKKY